MVDGISYIVEPILFVGAPKALMNVLVGVVSKARSKCMGSLPDESWAHYLLVALLDICRRETTTAALHEIIYQLLFGPLVGPCHWPISYDRLNKTFECVPV